MGGAGRGGRGGEGRGREWQGRGGEGGEGRGGRGREGRDREGIIHILTECLCEQEMCVQYWTKDKLKQHGDLFVELSQETSYANYTMREFSLTNTKVGGQQERERECV